MKIDPSKNLTVPIDLTTAATTGCMVAGCHAPTAVPGGGFCRAHGDAWAAQTHIQATFKRWAEAEDARILERLRTVFDEPERALRQFGPLIDRGTDVRR